MDCLKFLFLFISIFIIFVAAIAIYDFDWSLQPRHRNDVIVVASTSQTVDSGANFAPTDSSVIPDSPSVEQYPFNAPAQRTLPPRAFWRAQFLLPEARAVRFDVSVPSFAVVALYLRRSVLPTHAQYDVMHVIDGASLTSIAESQRSKRSISSQVRVSVACK